MKVVYCKSPKQVAEKAHAMLLAALKAKKARGSQLRVLTPTGQSPRPLYELIVKNKKVWKTKLSPIQIDEFVDVKKIFSKDLTKHLLNPLGVKAMLINPRWDDEEISNHISKTVNEGIDVAILGLGPNGHVGFHEPGNNDHSFLGGRVVLSEASLRRVQGATTNQAVTFGAGSFLKAKKIILIVTGESKREVFEKFLETPPTASLPATLLKIHPDLIVLSDLERPLRPQ